MIARVNIDLPFSFTIPKDEAYPLIKYEYLGYEITILPFTYNENEGGSLKPETKINGVNAYHTNRLIIDYKKDDYPRKNEDKWDPSPELIEKTANHFIKQIRDTVKAPHIKSINIGSLDIRITYLNDDGTELEKTTGYVRGRGRGTFSVSITPITIEAWNKVGSADLFEDIPVWKSIILDAQDALPEIGISIVLSHTALEVFISTILDDIAKYNHFDPILWDWINKRTSSLKDPSVEEQFDFLLKHLTQTSLKDDGALWESFINLKKARNSFVHSGIATIDKVTVDLAKAQQLNLEAQKIIEFIKCLLPDELKGDRFAQEAKIEFIMPVQVAN